MDTKVIKKTNNYKAYKRRKEELKGERIIKKITKNR
jgi:hypothetical protein